MDLCFVKDKVMNWHTLTLRIMYKTEAKILK